MAFNKMRHTQCSVRIQLKCKHANIPAKQKGEKWGRKNVKVYHLQENFATQSFYWNKLIENEKLRNPKYPEKN